MVTGETTDSHASNGPLILGWDGEALHWMAWDGDRVQASGVSREPSEWGALAQRFDHMDSVFLTRLRPPCSLLPTAVAAGIESEVLQLHHGRNQWHRAFQSELLGEGLTLIESGFDHSEAALQGAFPLGQWCSVTLRWLEVNAMQGPIGTLNSTVFIDVGEKKALMSRFDSGQLKWCTVTEDLAGDGLLYHTVNALYRDGIPLDPAPVNVVFSGGVSMMDDRVRQFKRFFKSVAVNQGDWNRAGTEKEEGSDWYLLSHARR